jgi:2-C-methyl-D-erythritol 2,4-cyclodiphosphate synthase
MLHQHAFLVVNVDATVVLQEPKISSYVQQMKAGLAPILGITETDVSIKATTTEDLGFAGRREGIAAYAVAMVMHRDT